MARYFFNLYDRSGATLDKEGIEVDDPERMRRMALENARAIICQDAERGSIDLAGRIEIEDTSGKVVLVLSFSEAVALKA